MKYYSLLGLMIINSSCIQGAEKVGKDKIVATVISEQSNPALYEVLHDIYTFVNTPEKNDVTKTLINKLPHVNIYEKDFALTPLMAASIANNQEIAQFVLNREGADIDATVQGETALMKEVVLSHVPLEAIQFLINKGADVNAMYGNVTILGKCVDNFLNVPGLYKDRIIEIIKMLIRAGANPKAGNTLALVNGAKSTPALPQKDIELLKEIFAPYMGGAGAPGGPAFPLADSGDIKSEKDAQQKVLNRIEKEAGDKSKTEELISLIDKYFPTSRALNEVTYGKTGDTALTLAAEGNNLRLIEHLLKRGADATITNKNDDSPLMIIALQSGDSFPIMQMLIEYTSKLYKGKISFLLDIVNRKTQKTVLSLLVENYLNKDSMFYRDSLIPKIKLLVEKGAKASLGKPSALELVQHAKPDPASELDEADIKQLRDLIALAR